MQRVIKMVHTNLVDLKLAIEGTIVMSEYLRESLDAMYDARIPSKWQKVKKFQVSYKIFLKRKFARATTKHVPKIIYLSNNLRND